MKPRLVHNWPQVKDDNDLISQRIKEAIDTYTKNKSKHDDHDDSHMVNKDLGVKEYIEMDEKKGNLLYKANDSPNHHTTSLFHGLKIKDSN
jgi:hypothetical protein